MSKPKKRSVVKCMTKVFEHARERRGGAKGTRADASRARPK